jgi:hypothetical protein
VGELQVLPHAHRVDDHPLDEREHPPLHVIEQRRRVGQGDPLDRRVGDVALVPQRDVLQAGARVAAQQAGEPRYLLGPDGIALVGHRAGSLLTGRERLTDLRQLGAGEVADLGRQPLQARPGEGDRLQ